MSLATRAIPASSAGWTTAAGCASCRRSLRISLTSEGRLAAPARVLHSRAIRIFLASIFIVVIVSPAIVVGAVVWTAPPVTITENPPTADTQPARLLAPPDIQPTSLPNPVFNVYANDLSGTVPCPLCEIPQRVYVPNSGAGTVDVIDPNTYKVIDHFRVGRIPHHIAPAWDMGALYVDNEGSSSLTVINIHTGKPASTIPIPYPYNLYFTPDGTKAINVVERQQRVEFRDWRHGWKLLKSVGIP